MEGRLLLFLHLIQASLFPTCQSITPTEYENKVDQTLNQVMSCASWIPGLTVAVVKDLKTLYTRGYGETMVNSNIPVTDQTLFQIGSISKSFAALLLVKQMEEANLGLLVSTKVKDMMDEGFFFVDAERTQEATVVDILAHRMGVPDHTNLRLDQNLTRANLHQRFKQMTAVKNFRKSFLYSNMMYGFATYLPEKMSNGNSWENLVTSEIFLPLNMTSSTFITTIPDLSNAARGYDKGPTSKPNALVPIPLDFSKKWGLWAGSGSIMSNAVDMAEYMNFHLSNKDKNGNLFMSTMSFDALHQEHRKLYSTTVNTYFGNREVPTTENGYGLGWKRGTYRGNDILLHSGSTFGYRSFITLFPNQNIGVFTSMNGEDDNYILRVLMHNFLSDVALEVTPWLDASSICAELTKPKYVGYSNTNNPSRFIGEYVGTYHNPIYGCLSVTMDLNNEHLVLKYGVATWDLWTKSGKDKFKAEGTGDITYLKNMYYITFITNNLDEIVSIEIDSLCKTCGENPPVFMKI
ncbi:protein flp-like [Saccostrea cucullata]|uniref:protein flp-like n=1 Tax=Saccostrea cuccullata TaxID=36930 RepID=UPI002ED644D4